MSDQTIPNEITPNDAIIDKLFVTGNVGIGIGTDAPKAPLHVKNYMAVGPFAATNGEGGIEVTGKLAEFSFVRRNLTSWPAMPVAGDRFVWYNAEGTEGTARLWTEVKGDLVTVTANGNVGIGTTAPSAKLQIEDGSAPDSKIKFGSSGGGGAHHLSSKRDIVFNSDKPVGSERGCFYFRKTSFENLASYQNLVIITEPGDLKATGDVYARGVKLQSSRELKENIAELTGADAVETLQNLNPVKFNYKADSEKNQYIGFIAEEVPELVATSDRKTLNPMDIIAVLTQVVKEQQKTMTALAEKVKRLEAQTA